MRIGLGCNGDNPECTKLGFWIKRSFVMKDGFEKSVAARMPKRQKNRNNRPWNVDPVLLTRQVQEEVSDNGDVEGDPVTWADDSRIEMKEVDLGAIEDLSEEIGQILFQKKDAEIRLRKSQDTLQLVQEENKGLRDRLSDLERESSAKDSLETEIQFLNEQLEDADFHIGKLSSILYDKEHQLGILTKEKQELESRLVKVSDQIHKKAKLEVKAAILEKDLNVAYNRMKELEELLQREQKEKTPLVREVNELKDALDKVYTTLAHLRIKAKREVYGF